MEPKTGERPVKQDVLNGFAGLGACTDNWNRDKYQVTHVEINEEIAEETRRLQPEDQVIVGDAMKHIKENYQSYDFIWASPPCPSHSTIRKAGVGNGQYQAKYPDQRLWQVIFFLDQYFSGDYIVENVKPFYDENVRWELVKPQQVARHYIWSNFTAPKVDMEPQNIHTANNSEMQKWLGIQVKDNWESIEQRKVLRNCVHPKIGEKILESRKTRQVTLQ